MSPVWSCLAIAQPLPACQKRWYVLAVIVSPLSSATLIVVAGAGGGRR